MTKTKDVGQTQFDLLKWMAVALLVAAGVFANLHYSNYPVHIRIIAWIALAIVSILIATQTQKGQQALAFAKQSRVEMQKVVWPTKQETVRTTAMVVVIVFVVGFILWGIDSVLLWAIGLLTGHRG